MRIGDDEPDDELPSGLEERLSTFPVAAIHDDTDRLAATAEEIRQVAAIMDRMGIDDIRRQQLRKLYLTALDARLVEAGKLPPLSDRAGTGFVMVARPRGVPRRAFVAVRWLGSRIGDPARAWVANRRVGWRRRRWRRLLAR